MHTLAYNMLTVGALQLHTDRALTILYNVLVST
jgi:hypothetical protein